MKYKAVIFDFDDTLVESRLLKWAQHKHVAKKFYNLDLTDEDIREHWGKPLDALIYELYRKSDTVEEMHKKLSSVTHGYMKKVYDGSPDVMKKLRENNIEIGVVSATNKNYLIEDLVRLEFPVDEMFIMQGSDEVSAHKPDPGVFVPALKKLKEKGITKEEIVYVGDSLDDIRAAHGAGINFIALTTGLYTEEDFRNAGAKVILSKIGELLDFI